MLKNIYWKNIDICIANERGFFFSTLKKGTPCFLFSPKQKQGVIRFEINKNKWIKLALFSYINKTFYKSNKGVNRRNHHYNYPGNCWNIAAG